MTIKLECFITFIINEPDLNKKLSISQQLNDLKSWTAIIYNSMYLSVFVYMVSTLTSTLLFLSTSEEAAPESNNSWSYARIERDKRIKFGLTVVKVCANFFFMLLEMWGKSTDINTFPSMKISKCP